MLAFVQRADKDEASSVPELIKLQAFNFSFVNDVEFLAFLSLFENELIFIERHRLKPVHKFQLLVLVQLIKQLHLIE